MKMKAAILSELNKPLIIGQVELPDDLLPGQVLVKVLYSGICGSQLGEIDGKKGKDNYLPHLLGHEGSGEVIKIGPGVQFVKQGDLVVMHWRKGQGIDAPCPKYLWEGKKLNAGFVTTFNEYAIVSENRLTLLPVDFPLDIAPLLGCAVTTGLGVINNNAKVKIGESVVVLGAGGVGLNIIQGATMSGAYPVVAVDIHDNRLEMASKFGATHLVNSVNESDLYDKIKSVIEESNVDVVIDNTGNTNLINMAYTLTKPDGRTILVGVPKKDDKISIFSLDLHFGKIITGSHGGETQPVVDIPRYIKLYNNKKLLLDDLITDRYSIDDINLAIDNMKNGKTAGRCLIEMHK
ncbi:zinc-binding dehydrogenase [Desulfobacterales bacterium HSG17]|nr:zinc-binding dehydrogenase [Desulfobacterales bacterium HSG17]